MNEALRVIVVDDSATDADLVVEELRRSGRPIEAERVETVAAMREALERASWHVVIVEWATPTLQGPAALALLEGFDVPLIIASREIDDETAFAAMRLGAKDCVTKDRLARLVPAVERELREQEIRKSSLRIATLAASVGMALAHGGSLRDILQRCVDAMIVHVDATLACIWTLNAQEGVLEIQARAGMDTDDEPPIADASWAEQKGMAGFVCHPLIVAAQRVGLLALYSRRPFTEPARNGLSTLTDALAVGIQRKLGEAAELSLAAQLRQAQKMEAVGRLASSIAHDFNNVLSVISHAAMIAADLDPGDPKRNAVEEIRTAGVRASNLTRKLLMFSRQAAMDPQVLDIHVLLSGMHDMLRRLLGEDVVLSVIPSAEVGRVCIDPGSIEQVIMNLAINARDAMPMGGQLTIETANRVSDAGMFVVASFTDTGTGIDEATLAKIFEPFFTTKEVGHGTGLGLSTVFGIVQQSGGEIRVRSALGRGTTFEVELPRVAGIVDESALPTAVATQQTSATTIPGTETILLVEDEEQVREVARGILLRSGYTVLDARDAAQALSLSDGHAGEIHLLLSDVVMPRMSGPELAKRLVQARPEMKVLCMSGYTADVKLRHPIDAGFGYLQKPLTPQALTRKIRDVLDTQ